MGEAAERSDPPLIRMGRRRQSPWVQVYNEFIDLYQPHSGGFAGVGYWTYLRRFVNHDPENGWRCRAFPNKRQLKADGQVGADRLKNLERLCIAWGLLDVEVVRHGRHAGGRLVGETRRFLYRVIRSAERGRAPPGRGLGRATAPPGGLRSRPGSRSRRRRGHVPGWDYPVVSHIRGRDVGAQRSAKASSQHECIRRG